MTVPEFILERWVKIKIEKNKLDVTGIDESGTPYSYIKRIKINGKLGNTLFPVSYQAITLDLEFFNHYGEGILQFEMPKKIFEKVDADMRVKMLYNPHTQKWESVTIFNSKKEELMQIDFKEFKVKKLTLKD